jgi:hypothetical protein
MKGLFELFEYSIVHGEYQNYLQLKDVGRFMILVIITEFQKFLHH